VSHRERMRVRMRRAFSGSVVAGARRTSEVRGLKRAAERTSESVALVAKDEGQIVRVAAAPLRCRPVPKHLTCGASRKAHLSTIPRTRKQQKAVTGQHTAPARTGHARIRASASVYSRGCSRSAGGAPCGARGAGIRGCRAPSCLGRKNKLFRIVFCVYEPGNRRIKQRQGRDGPTASAKRCRQYPPWPSRPRRSQGVLDGICW
jgi:hypothetical protein